MSDESVTTYQTSPSGPRPRKTGSVTECFWVSSADALVRSTVASPAPAAVAPAVVVGAGEAAPSPPPLEPQPAAIAATASGASAAA